MSSRLKRLTRLEDIAARRRPTRPFTDPYSVAMVLFAEFEVVAAGRACWIPRPEPSEAWSEATAAAFERQMRDYESMHKRLTAKPAE